MNPPALKVQSSDPDIEATVAAPVARARAAQAIADGFDQARTDELVAAAGWAILEPGRNQALAELAVADSGIGKVADKVQKNHRKNLGLTEIARPVGAVCAITPCTKPAATPANKIINALKGRNAVIVAPSPKGWRTAARLIEHIHAELGRIGAPLDRVQLLPQPVSKVSTAALMRQCDLVLRAGMAVDEAGLRAFCEQHLGRYKTPRLIRFVAALPRAPSGKVQRRKLLDDLP